MATQSGANCLNWASRLYRFARVIKLPVNCVHPTATMKRHLLFAIALFAASIASNRVWAQCGTTPITGDLIISSDQQLSGTYNITGLFQIDAGVTVSVTPYTANGCGELVINANAINVVGNIDADGAGFPGGAGGAGATAGNNVGALTGCIDKDNCLVIDVNGGAGGAAGGGAGGGASGVAGTQGRGPKQQCQNFGDTYGFVAGAGGGGSGAGGAYGAASGTGGAGGNAAAYNSGNFSGMSIASCTTPQTGNGGAGGTASTLYGTPTGGDIDLGSGGGGASGGGRSATVGVAGAAGGNGGGKVVLNSATTVVISGNVSASGTGGGSGGNGGNGGTTSDCCSDTCNDCGERTFASGAGGGGGAGGGSGGGIYVFSPALATINGTLRVEGGDGGAGGFGGAGHQGCTYSNFFCGSNSGNSNAGSDGSQGGGGSGGRIKVFKNPCLANVITPTNLIDGGAGNGGAASPGTFNNLDITTIVPPAIAGSSTAVSCFGVADGTASVSVSGGTGPYTYTWSPNVSTGTSASALAGGQYTVTVIDQNGCQDQVTLTVAEPPQLDVTVFGVIDASCFGASTGEASALANGGSAPINYQWNDPGLQVGPTATNLPAGTWQVLVTDANGCQGTGSVAISQPAAFNASVTIDQSVACNGQSNGQATVVVANPNPLITYLWQPSNQITATATGLTAGSYTVTLTISATCDTTIAVVITEPGVLSPLAVQNQAVTCSGGNDGVAIVSQTGGTPPFTYLWNDPNLQTTALATGLVSGTYVVTVVDANQCNAQSSVSITEPLPIAVSATTTAALCNGLPSGTATATATGGNGSYSFQWNDPLNQTGQTANGLLAGTYNVVVTDAQGCTGVLNGVVVTEPSPILVGGTVTNVSCFGASTGSVSATATGGTGLFNFQWNDPSNQSGQVAQGLAAGQYVVTVTDGNGCVTQSQPFNVTQPNELDLQIIVVSNETCVGSADGSASALVSGGTAPYAYTWVPSGQTGSTAIGLAAGSQSLAITDANGCSSSQGFVIAPPTNPMEASFAFTPETGEQPLAITFTNTTSGGTEYHWFFGDGNQQFTYTLDPFQYQYSDSGMFSITMVAFDAATGCYDTAYSANNIYIVPTSFLEVPNVITPNGDGINDMFPIDPLESGFFPFRIRNIKTFEGYIFNRWGQKVYEWAMPLGGWDGRTLSGNELPQGTYFYMIRAVGIDGDNETEYTLNGPVTLLR